MNNFQEIPPSEGRKILFARDGGMPLYVRDCEWFRDFQEIPEFSNLGDLDWRSVYPGTSMMDGIIKILRENGYAVELNSVKTNTYSYEYVFVSRHC